MKGFAGADGLQDIRTMESFRSFELQFDWRILSGGNSGVKYLIQRVDEWRNASGRQARARGLEYQLAYATNSDAASDPRRVAASLYSLLAPRPQLTPRIGEYNHSRLVVISGHHIEHWLNGIKVVDFDTQGPEVQRLLRGDLPKDSAPGTPLIEESPISLQNHGSAAWFRNVKILVAKDQ